MGKWFVILLATVLVLGILYWQFPSMASVAFRTPSMWGTTPIPSFGISWMFLTGVGIAIFFKKLAK